MRCVSAVVSLSSKVAMRRRVASSMGCPTVALLPWSIRSPWIVRSISLSRPSYITGQIAEIGRRQRTSKQRELPELANRYGSSSSTSSNSAPADIGSPTRMTAHDSKRAYASRRAPIVRSSASGDRAVNESEEKMASVGGLETTLNFVGLDRPPLVWHVTR